MDERQAVLVSHELVLLSLKLVLLSLELTLVQSKPMNIFGSSQNSPL
ncbi:hypothetical protein [Lentibacillus salinarum]|uniref:Uncharacterized protein n=1 Tax=Lentibacillus salinarum TaxID=446820 RepID=A0ABW3ZX69_9BACI